MQNLNREIRVFVDRLFPFHDFQNNSLFPKVQSQDDGNKCDFMAVAIATSILFGINPCIVTIIELCSFVR